MLISSHWMDQIVISVHIRSSCNILFQGVRNVPQSILYALYWFIYSLCVYVQQCLGECSKFKELLSTAPDNETGSEQTN